MPSFLARNLYTYAQVMKIRHDRLCTEVKTCYVPKLAKNNTLNDKESVSKTNTLLTH